ncbi:cell division control protein 48 homolog B-like [Zingiber officinale]|uniref:cell division control protein 48 homolog B-like n=2 Tax=Zingiber officinale TaxID=94328 RepID=UPI001C4CFD85|nr:cell division control protein 48 homolog B-like isoform X1 [Zingiber officinale]XP_042384888.1 cell division control protein 48 homolog B-like [Zingiber officinale]
MEGNGSRKEGVWRAEDEIAGNSRAIQALRELIIYPFIYAEEARDLGLKWPRGLLLYGPPGTGKTSLVKAIVHECDGHLTMISPYSVHKSYAGESEKFLRESFTKAYSYASSGKPSVIFIDEIDAICPHRSSRREQETRIVGQLLTLMDGNKSRSKSLPHIVVVASTNRVDGIDPALRRPGRFDSEIEVTLPTMEERLQILELYSKNFQLDDNVDLQAIATSCNGYVGADLEALVREASRFAHRRLSGTIPGGDGATIVIKMEDWESARSEVCPSVTKGITEEVTKVSWDDIGGLKDLKKKHKQAVEWPIKHADAFARLGISPVRGVLLHGPPGCSKTTLAKAAATASQASFFSLSGAELYSKYVGEGEALLRRIFQKARLAAPSIIFFDEVDSIAPKRGHGENSGSNVNVGERLLTTLLTEMDGLEEATGIVVLAATNRPDAIDAALLRPGRFDSVLYVPPPDAEGRHEILRIHTKQMKLGEDVDLQKIAECTDLFTGADLEGLCREAGIAALREDKSTEFVSDRHFQIARDALRPSLTQSKVDEYARAKFHR